VLGTGEFLLGRGLFCDVVIDGPSVSRQHARILIRGGSTTVSDLGSRNGVHVNGEVAWREHPLSDGDVLKLGSEEILVTFEPMGTAEDRDSVHGEETQTSTFRADLTDEPPNSRRLDDAAIAVRLARRALEAGDVVDADRLLRPQMWVLLRDLSARRRVDVSTLDAAVDLALQLAAAGPAVQWLESAVALLAARREPLGETLFERLRAVIRRLAPVETSGLVEYERALLSTTDGSGDEVTGRRFRQLRDAARQSTSRH